MNQEDADASALLAPYTFLPMDEVAAVRTEAAAAPEKRVAQRRLAREVTAFVHGKDAADRAAKAAGVLFGEGSIREVDPAMLQEALEGVPSVTVPRSRQAESRLPDLFMAAGLLKSKSEFARHLKQGSLYLNGDRIVDAAAREPIAGGEVLQGGVLVLRRGKKDYALVRIVDG